MQQFACVLLFWLLVLRHSHASNALSPLLTNEAVGVRVYNLVVPFQGFPQHLRLFLRSSCREQNRVIIVYGFIGIFPMQSVNRTSHPRGAEHYKSYVIAERPQLLLIRRGDNSSTPLSVVHVGNDGFLRVEALLTSPGVYDLSSAGAVWNSPMALPFLSCNLSRDSSTAFNPNIPFSPGLWNVLTTTSNSVLTIEDLAFLILQHHRYHRRVGFQGTIVRGSIAQAQMMAKLDLLQEALKNEQLLIWPWVSSNHQPAAPFPVPRAHCVGFDLPQARSERVLSSTAAFQQYMVPSAASAPELLPGVLPGMAAGLHSTRQLRQ
jgi:hypothetical protein